MLPWPLPQTVHPCKWRSPTLPESRLKPEGLHLLSLPQLAEQAEARWFSCPLAQLQYKHFTESFHPPTENALTTGLCTKGPSNSCCWFFQGHLCVLLPWKLLQMKTIFVFREGIFHLTLPILKEKSFLFLSKWKSWMKICIGTNQTNICGYLVQWPNKQIKYFIHPTLQAKTNVSWHMKARKQICFNPDQWIRSIILESEK